MHRNAFPLVLLISVAMATTGCARRWGRGDITSLDPLIGDRPESSAPIVSNNASAQNNSDGTNPEGEKSPATTADADVESSSPSENRKPAEKFAAKFTQDEKSKPAGTKGTGKTPEKLSPAAQEELERTLAVAGTDISPLVRQQLIAILEFSRQKEDAQRDADTVVVTSADAPNSSTNPAEKKTPASAQALNPPTTMREFPPTNTPHVTVNVTTAAPAQPDLTLLHAKEKEAAASLARSLPATNTQTSSGREIPRNNVDVPLLLATHGTSVSNAVRTDNGPEKLTLPVSPSTSPATDETKNEKPSVRKGQWREGLIQAIEALDDELRTEGIAPRGDEKTRLTAYNRLLNLIADRREDAVREIESLDKQQKEYWKKQVLALAVALDAEGIPAEGRRSALALRHLREAANHLAAESTLDVRNLSFCSKVDGYGVYNEFPKNDFKADQEVLLYVEIDNFTVEEKSASRKSPSFETELRGTYEIYDAAGHRVSDFELPLDKQTCRNHRRDYFIAYRIYMPKRLDPGQYTLRLSIEDVKGRKHGQASIEMSIKP